MWTHRLAMTLVSMASMAVLAQAPPPMPPEPQAAPASVQQPNAPTGSAAALTEDPAMEEAVRMIPRVAKRRETVIDGKRVVRVATEAGLEYELIEEDGVVVTTVLQPESERLRVPLWRLFEW